MPPVPTALPAEAAINDVPYLLNDQLLRASNVFGGGSSRGNSRLQSILRCEEYWYNRFVGDLKEQEGAKYEAEIGTCLHVYAAFKFGRDLPLWPDWLRTESVKTVLEKEGLCKTKQHLEAKRIWDPFKDRVFLPGQVFAVEQEFGATLAELGCVKPISRLANEVVTTKSDCLTFEGDTIFNNDFKTTRYISKRDCEDLKHKFNPQSCLAVAILKCRFPAYKIVFRHVVFSKEKTPRHDSYIVQPDETVMRDYIKVIPRLLVKEQAFLSGKARPLRTGAVIDICQGLYNKRPCGYVTHCWPQFNL